MRLLYASTSYKIHLRSYLDIVGSEESVTDKALVSMTSDIKQSGGASWSTTILSKLGSLGVITGVLGLTAYVTLQRLRGLLDGWRSRSSLLDRQK